MVDILIYRIILLITGCSANVYEITYSSVSKRRMPYTTNFTIMQILIRNPDANM